jgi:hypothetical protein
MAMLGRVSCLCASREVCVRASAEAGVRGCCEVPDRWREAGAACTDSRVKRRVTLILHALLLLCISDLCKLGVQQLHGLHFL